MFPQINFQWVPMALVITNSFARRADEQQAAQGLDLVECLPKLLNEPLALSFRLLPLGFVSLAFGPLFGLIVQNQDVECCFHKQELTNPRLGSVDIPSVKSERPVLRVFIATNIMRKSARAAIRGIAEMISGKC